jgi:predicted DCC family thiol-disulfide oxidoreductase YuxK
VGDKILPQASCSRNGIIASSDPVTFNARQRGDQAHIQRAPTPDNGRPEIQELFVQPDPSKVTVYFDGSCPLCQAEIGYYRRQDEATALCFVDVSGPGAMTPDGVTRQHAMKRFHVRTSDGQVLSGAAAFVEIWARLPRWRWAARAASLPGALTTLELSYRLFLTVRPFISRLLGRILQFKAVASSVRRG